MMNKPIFLILIFLLFLPACRKKVLEDQMGTIIGELQVDLDANEFYIRTQESLIGNFVCDAIKAHFDAENIYSDFVMMNAGAIRFNPQSRPSGIYPKGPFTSQMAEEMLPFTNNLPARVKVSGSQLKEILERSVAQLPLDKGAFMQFSAGIAITVDPSQQPQILDETVNPAVIVSPGSRIVSVLINDVPLSDSEMYTFITNDYIVKANDGYVTFLSVPASNIDYYSNILANLVIDYVTVNSPMNPVISGRVNF